MASEKKTKIIFKKSPTGVFGLAYSEGETASLEVKQAKELIELGFAEKIK